MLRMKWYKICLYTLNMQGRSPNDLFIIFHGLFDEYQAYLTNENADRSLIMISVVPKYSKTKGIACLFMKLHNIEFLSH